MVRRTMLGLAGAALAVVLSVAGVAWACTEMSSLGNITPRTAAVGAEVTVPGVNFAEGPVAIRWGTPSGRLLATAQGPNFSARVTIPEAAPGSHYIYGVQTVDGTTYERGGVVTIPKPVASDGDQPAGEPTSATPSGPAAAVEAAPAADTLAPSAPGATGQPANDPATPARARQLKPAAPAATKGAVAGSRSAKASAPEPVSPAANPATNETAVSAESAPLPSAQSVAGDLWSGFGSGMSTRPLGPGLVGGPVSSGNGSGLGAGLVLLSLGAITMAAVCGLALKRSPKAQVSSSQ